MRAAGTWIALLRGINVGTAKRVAMADLRRLLEGLGYADVRTILNSGNAVFTADADEPDVVRTVEAAIADQMDIQVSVIVRSARELSSVVGANPFVAEGLAPTFLAVSFFDVEPAAAAWRALGAGSYLPDRWAKGERCAYLAQPNGFSGSNLPDLGKVLGVVPTARNWATTTKLAALAGS